MRPLNRATATAINVDRKVINKSLRLWTHHVEYNSRMQTPDYQTILSGALNIIDPTQCQTHSNLPIYHQKLVLLSLIKTPFKFNVSLFKILLVPYTRPLTETIQFGSATQSQLYSLTVTSHECHSVSSSRHIGSLFNRLFIKENINAPHDWMVARGIHRWPMDSLTKEKAINAESVSMSCRYHELLSSNSKINIILTS